MRISDWNQDIQSAIPKLAFSIRLCSRSPIRQETTDSRSVQWGFESLREYQFKQFIARVAQLEEAADLRSAFMMSSNLSTRTNKSAIRNLWGVRQARLKPLDFQSRDAWVRIPHALPTPGANADRDYILKM